jgi:quinol monooxygenase YgiN
MHIGRRELVGSSLAWSLLGPALARQGKGESMFGLIGRMVTVPGERDAMIAILLEGTTAMPGCLNYIVAKDASDENAIWITEVWDSKASHDASLALPQVKAAITKGRPLIASFGPGSTTEPVGGVGLAPAD